jgi:CubicO group peptidase (beta-lactamase class C family)
MRRPWLLATLLLACTGPLLAAPPAQIDPARVDAIAAEAIAQWRFPGIAVAVVQDDRVTALVARGVTRVDGSVPITADTLFEIGSTTKAFTTTAMALLVDEKKMDWDDPVRRYVPWFHLSDPCADALVTLRDIVTHRTGLATRDELWDAARYPRLEFLHRLAYVPLAKPFRSAYQYSNMMFALAGETVAAASGTPWEAFVRARIFEPLGMTHTVTSLADWNASRHATGHYLDRKHDRIAVQAFNDYENIASAGAVKSCARDLAQWLRFQLADGAIGDKRLLSADALLETHRPQIPLGTDPELGETNLASYALGWSVADYRGTLLVSHGGALNGFRTQVALLPRLHAGVVVLANAGLGLGVAAARNRLLDELLGLPPSRDWNAYFHEADRKSLEKRAATQAERERKRAKGTHPTHALADYAGTYLNAGYGPITIGVVDGALSLRWTRVTIPLRHFAYDTFSATDPAEDIDELVEFRLDPEGEVRAFRMFDLDFVRE